MRTAIVCLALLAFLVLPVGTAPTVGKPEEVGLSSERLHRIAQMIQRRIAAGDLAGAVVAVGRKGRVAYVNAQGVMDLETKQPMTPANMFRIASMTKPVVGVGIMLLVEEGKMRINDPVSRYIPEFRNMKVAVAQTASGARGAGAGGPPPANAGGQTASPQFYTVPAQREITIKDLLTHTSGLGSGPMGNSDIEKIARKNGETLAQYIPRLGGTALEFQPGSRWTYSPGAAFETLGRVIEIVSGMPLDRFFRTRIFDPLGMKDITFWPTDAQMPRLATVYARTPNGLTKTAMPNDTMSRNVYFRGSGGLYSTAEDYLPLGIMLAAKGEIGGGKRLLSRKTVEMFSAAHVLDTLPGRPAGEGYGLSVRVVTNHAARGTMLSDGTFGWTGAQGTHFFVDPKEELTAVLMVQTSNGEIQRDFEDLVAQSVAD
jgi:CubicO group peptidase (beta-lactamase class C family)